MKVPRNIYVRELAHHLISYWDYKEDRPTGSHIILRTGTPSGQTLPIPAHKPLKTGTLTAILRMLAEHKDISRGYVLKNLR